MSRRDCAEPFEIILSPPPVHFPAAVALYLEAFHPKLGPIFGPRARAAAFLTPGFQAERALVAIRGGEVLGIAGFRHHDKGLFDRPARDFVREYGWSSPWRMALLAIVERAETPDFLLMDGIAVSPSARGQGIGTALLAALCDHARTLGKTGVRLDVIDSNARARALYAREGFIAQETINIGPLAWIFPFTATTRMIKPV